MASAQEQLDALTDARKKILERGSATVSINGRSVTFLSLAELDAAEKELRRQIDRANRGPSLVRLSRR